MDRKGEDGGGKGGRKRCEGKEGCSAGSKESLSGCRVIRGEEIGGVRVGLKINASKFERESGSDVKRNCTTSHK